MIQKYPSHLLYIAIIGVWLTLSGAIVADNLSGAIALTIKAGNSKELASFFNSNIELVITDQENVYSRSQAEQVLRDFFQRNTPQSFSIIHQGSKDNSNFAIGNLVTSTGTFRVYFLIKTTNNNSYIHQFRIEK